MSNHVQKIKGRRLSPLHICAIIVAASLLTYLLSRSFAATGTAAFTVEPVSATVSQGATHELLIYVTPTGSTMQSAGVSVNIPSQLQYQSFSSAGSSFSISAAVTGDTVGSTKVTIAAGYTAGNSGAMGAKLYLGKLVTTATTVGSGTVTLSDQQAQDPTEAYMTTTIASAAITVTPPPQPDLVVTGITTTPATPAPGSVVSFTASVKNQGTAATTAGVVHGVNFVVNGTTVTANTYTTSIAAGATVNISSNAGSTWAATVGTFTATATVDSGALIAESNETNNSFSKSITVADTVAPTVTFTFPGLTGGEALASDVITVTSIPQAVVRPTVADNVAVTSSTYKVNGVAVTLTGGQYTLTNKNGDYSFNVTAVDAAGNTLNKTITVKVRYTDINRDGGNNLADFTKLLLTWGSVNAECDLDGNGTVGLGDFTRLLLRWTN